MAILEAAIVSTPEECNNNSPMTPNKYEHNKNPSAIKPLRQFLEALYVRHKTDVLSLGAAKANHDSIITGNLLW